MCHNADAPHRGNCGFFCFVFLGKAKKIGHFSTARNAKVYIFQCCIRGVLLSHKSMWSVWRQECFRHSDPVSADEPQNWLCFMPPYHCMEVKYVSAVQPTPKLDGNIALHKVMMLGLVLSKRFCSKNYKTTKKKDCLYFFHCLPIFPNHFATAGPLVGAKKWFLHRG